MQPNEPISKGYNHAISDKGNAFYPSPSQAKATAFNTAEM